MDNNYRVRRLQAGDIDALCSYLHGLSDETRRRFGPHPFNRHALTEIFLEQDQFLGYIATYNESDTIIAYSVIKKGYLEHDSPRLRSYGLELSMQTDCTFAPSVADDWQGKGVGTRMFGTILDDLKNMGFHRIILWGGVQSGNEPAVKYYNRLGFITLGQFEYYGMNLDMILPIRNY